MSSPVAPFDGGSAHAGGATTTIGRLQLPGTIVLLALGGTAWLAGQPAISDVLYAVATLIAFVPAVVDRLQGLADAVRIARRTRRIAWQSVVVGMGLSIVAMGFAAAGLLPPVAGAVVQEAIDLAVILNALRALRGARRRRRRGTAPTAPPEILADHRHLASGLEDLADLAERLEELSLRDALAALHRTQAFLIDELLPHELEEEHTVYPAVTAIFPGEDPTAPLVRSRHEIARRIRLFARLVDDLPDAGWTTDGGSKAIEQMDREDVVDLQRALWGLHAVLDLHVTLEDDLYSQLPAPTPVTRDEATHGVA